MRYKAKDGIYVESSIAARILNKLMLGRFPQGEVDWGRYAQQYDAVTIDLKPAYQKIMRMPLEGEIAQKLGYKKYELICDLGAGTGNLSIPLAAMHQHLIVAHIDSDETYNNIAQSKASKAGVTNMNFHVGDAEDVKKVQDQYGKPFDVVFMIHALYAMRDKGDMDKPQRVLKLIYESLKDGGYLWITDIEREMNLLQLIVDGLVSAIKKYGLRRSLVLFKEMDQAKYQNANVIRRQREGLYITQKLEGLVNMVCEAGFKENSIIYKSGFEFYHGYDNIVVARK